MEMRTHPRRVNAFVTNLGVISRNVTLSNFDKALSDRDLTAREFVPNPRPT